MSHDPPAAAIVEETEIFTVFTSEVVINKQNRYRNSIFPTDNIYFLICRVGILVIFLCCQSNLHTLVFTKKWAILSLTGRIVASY